MLFPTREPLIDRDEVAFYFAALLTYSHSGGCPSHIKSVLDEYRMAVTNVSKHSDADAWEAHKSSLRDKVLLDLQGKGLIHRFQEEMKIVQEGRADFNRMQQVVPGLWLGSFHPANDRYQLRTQGITHICCCVNLPPRFPSDFEYHVIPADDTPSENISRFFPKAIEFIRDAIHRGGKVLVHCGAGISRAPTICTAFLMDEFHLPMDKALNLVQTQRPFASPNTGFMAQLRVLDSSLAVRRNSKGAAGGESANPGPAGPAAAPPAIAVGHLAAQPKRERNE
ncbi:unnamed protein product [Vitrella brassicaformis CCMP3155]|uniref:Protein-serine/threonine phosphatase n=2 Tax=Vitrella brassicaformis TaxID=1169539 RepID=A0A0G4EK63_VITBC|nr:unnamed protein product [Vitrella brassicaformis CCMP3155]|eukprot:CEL96944.1 unnamed protein product [Vitrella brassicaformis CCMP3155]